LITSTLPLGTLGSVVALLATTIYKENHYSNNKLWKMSSYRSRNTADLAVYMVSFILSSMG